LSTGETVKEIIMASRQPWKTGGDGIEYQYERVSINIPNDSSRNAPWDDETIEPALSPKTFDSNRLSDGVDDMHGEGVLSHGWHEVRQWMVEKYYDKNFKFMLVLLILVIAFGTVNRVIYRIQLGTPSSPQMSNYTIFISWVLTTAYCFLYFGIFSVRRYGLFIIDDEQVGYVFSWRGLKLIVMGLMDATGFVFGIFAARQINGFLLTLLPQAIIPMTMIVSLIALRTRYHWGQVLGAATLVSGLLISLIPTFQSEGSGDTSVMTAVWAGVYLLSLLPNAISFILREMVFTELPKMDIFVVNSFDSFWQLIFSVLMFPLVLIPGFSTVSFDKIGDYIPDGASCLAGFTPTPQDDCSGEPWLMMIYVCVNLSWNISLLLLLKKGGAVFTFIGSAVSLPLSHFAFVINWPIIGAGTVSWEDGLGLCLVLVGLVVYRYYALVQKKKLDDETRQKLLDPSWRPPASWWRRMCCGSRQYDD
jgi:hypothetical protein